MSTLVQNSLLSLKESLQIVEEIDRFFPHPGSVLVISLGHTTLQHLLEDPLPYEVGSTLLAELEAARGTDAATQGGLIAYSWFRLLDLCLASLRERLAQVSSSVEKKSNP